VCLSLKIATVTVKKDKFEMNHNNKVFHNHLQNLDIGTYFPVKNTHQHVQDSEIICTGQFNAFVNVNFTL